MYKVICVIFFLLHTPCEFGADFQKTPPDFRLPLLFLFFLFYKLIFRLPAARTFPIIRKVFKRSSGFNSMLWITDFRIVCVAAFFTLIFFSLRHMCSLFNRRGPGLDLGHLFIFLIVITNDFADAAVFHAHKTDELFKVSFSCISLA